MTDVKTHGLGARRDMARLLIDHAGVALVYQGIVATIGVASVIACLIWLQIW